MQDILISFETAKLAKEKGFDISTVMFYTACNKHYLTEAEDYQTERYAKSNWNNGQGSYPTKAEDVACSAPTQSLLQKWLREVRQINVESNYLPNIQKYRCLFKPMDIIPKNYDSYREFNSAISKYYGKENCNTYEEALEKGLQQALKLIN